MFMTIALSVSHKSEGHEHETHGQKTTTSPAHGEEAHREKNPEKKGIYYIFDSDSNVLVFL